MAYINEINGPKGIGNTGGPHKPISNDENAGVFNAMLEEKIKLGQKIPDNQPHKGYTNEKEFSTDLKEILKIVSPVIEEIVNTVISNSSLSPPSS